MTTRHSFTVPPELEGARLEVLEMDNRRITKVLFEYQMPEEPEEPESQIEEEKANRSVVRWSSEKLLKGIKKEEAEESADQKKESDVEEPELLEKKTGS